MRAVRWGDLITYRGSTFPVSIHSRAYRHLLEKVDRGEAEIIDGHDDPTLRSQREQEAIQQIIDRVWAERAEIQSDPRWGIDAVGVTKIASLTTPKALAIHGWLQSLYEEAWAKERAILAGEQDEVGEWTTPRRKPYPVAEALAEADA